MFDKPYITVTKNEDVVTETRLGTFDAGESFRSLQLKIESLPDAYGRARDLNVELKASFHGGEYTDPDKLRADALALVRQMLAELQL